MKSTYEEMVTQDRNISKTKEQIEEWYKSSNSIQDIGFEEIN